MRLSFSIVLLILGLAGELFADSPHHYLLGPDQAGFADWREKEFVDHTEYEQVSLDGEQVLKARSQGAASGLFREIEVDLNKTPILTWRWRVDAGPDKLDEESKSGDDFAARLYVVVSDGWFFWQTRTLNYVWSSREVGERSWPNPYAPDNAFMLPLRNGRTEKGQWVTEQRNVQADLKRYLGKHYDNIEAVAIMTDMDDSGSTATAYYGDIYFSAKEIKQ